MAKRQIARGLVVERLLPGKGFYDNALLFVVRAYSEGPKKGEFVTSRDIANALGQAKVFDGAETGHIEYRLHHGQRGNLIVEEMVEPFSQLEIPVLAKPIAGEKIEREYNLENPASKAPLQLLDKNAMGKLEEICFSELIRQLPGIPLRKITIRPMLTASNVRARELARRGLRTSNPGTAGVHPNYSFPIKQMQSSFRKRRQLKQTKLR
ncbi:Uncharacterised protein [uncultured archaeon]|nr:Uncharacterised protein [uncultured archaeon]